MRPTREHVALEKAICNAVEKHHLSGDSGNCALFASALREVLGEGHYICAGDHYEYADHVWLEWRGHLFDWTGLVPRREARKVGHLESFPNDDRKPWDEQEVLQLTDRDSGLCPHQDPRKLKRALEQEISPQRKNEKIKPPHREGR